MAFDRKSYLKEWAKDNPEYRKDYNTTFYKQNKERMDLATKKHRLKKTYGITLDDYNTLFAKQEGKCTICNTHQSQLQKSLAVDHCHTTKQVRGLLCMTCNTALGKFKDDINLLQNAINYLKK
jgi:hypothetical protein